MTIRRNIFILVLMLLVSISTSAIIKYPKEEVRAVWLTTIGGLDWPHSYAQSASSIQRQQNELCQTLDKLQKANINTVLIQTRIRATSLFQTTEKSGSEPWDGCLSGNPGKSPGYDALEFAINECHRRGMECHAWVVTIPVGKWNGYGCRQLQKRQPSLLIKIGDEGYMNPGDKRTATYLANYCADITRRYDIDGIHLDYIRYPETWKNLPNANVGRQNITNIVTAIHNAVKAEKRWVKMSCSPVGKHDDTRRFWSRGWNARSRVYQDAKEWMRRGLMDQEFPMMYFRGNNFYPFAVDWQEGSYGKMMVPGLGIYMLHPKEQNWKLEDITREFFVLRQLGMGSCMFRTSFFTADTKGLYSFVCNTLNRFPAAVPATTWLSSRKPEAPSRLRVAFDNGTRLLWNEGKDNSDGDYLTYNIYSSESYPVDINNAENIVALRYSGLEMYIKPATGKKSPVLYYAVTAVDRYGNESEACQLPSIPLAPTKRLKPGWWWVTHPIKAC